MPKPYGFWRRVVGACALMFCASWQPLSSGKPGVASGLITNNRKNELQIVMYPPRLILMDLHQLSAAWNVMPTDVELAFGGPSIGHLAIRLASHTQTRSYGMQVLVKAQVAPEAALCPVTLRMLKARHMIPRLPLVYPLQVPRSRSCGIALLSTLLVQVELIRHHMYPSPLNETHSKNRNLIACVSHCNKLKILSFIIRKL